MRKTFVLGSFFASVFAAATASAAVVPTTVSATGAFNGNLAVLNDGVVPANFSSYNSPDKVFYNGTQPPVFRFDFTGLATIDSLLINVDNNDDYQIRLFNGATLAQTVNIAANEGSVGFGVESFTRAFAPVQATYALVSMSGGDNAYGLGEVQFNGTLANAVPEPASWAMIIGGFGLVGGAMRRRPSRLMLSA